MPGYSGIPLPKKLGIKDGFHFFLIDAPPDVIAELKASLQKCVLVNDGNIALEFAMLFTKSAASYEKQFAKTAKNLAPAGMLWACWPKIFWHAHRSDRKHRSRHWFGDRSRRRQSLRRN